jgi:hypothetical protein
MEGADMMSSLQFGGSENLDVFLKEGAGGPYHIPGTYVWQNHRMPYTQAGQWGYLRVLPAADRKIQPLNGAGTVGGKTAEVPTSEEPRAATESAPGPVSMLQR